MEETERRLATRRRGSAVDRDVDLPRITVAIEDIDEAVAAHYGVLPADLESCLVCGGAAKFVAVGAGLSPDGHDPACYRGRIMAPSVPRA